MNVDLNVVLDLLVENMLGEFGQENGRRFAQLKECGVDAKLKTVRIFDIPDNSILINLDRYRQPETLFKDNRGQRTRCDYVLLTTFNHLPCMLFIEMKSRSVSDKEILKQFKSSECLMDYCNAVLNRFHEQNDLLKSFHKRFVVFYKPRSTPKRPSRPPCPSSSNDKPDNALKYPSPRNPTLGCLVRL